MKANNVSKLEAGDVAESDDGRVYEIVGWKNTDFGTYLIYEICGSEVEISFNRAMSKAFSEGWELVEDEKGGEENNRLRTQKLADGSGRGRDFGSARQMIGQPFHDRHTETVMDGRGPRGM